jgi:lambda repressor-like predicted transcriptional regulator
VIAPEPEWLTRLRAEAARTSIAATARRIGYSRPTVSAVLTGRYPAATDAIAQAVAATLTGRIACTHQDREIAEETCRTLAGGPMPTTSPAALRQWPACQSCPHNGTHSQTGGPDGHR